MAAMGLGQALRAALDLLDAGRAAEAEELCRRIIDAAPDSPDAAGVRGMALARLGRSPDAATAFLRAAYLDPRRADAAQTAFGLIRDHLRDRGAVIKAALCAAPGDADLWRLLTTTTEYAETSPKTLRLLTRVARSDPMQPATLLRLAGMTAELGATFDAADRTFQVMLAVDPGSAAAWFNRALTATRSGEPWLETAAQSARRAAQAAPLDVEALVFLARHRPATEEEGGGAARRALALAPDHAEGWRLSAMRCCAEGRPQEGSVAYGRLYRLTRCPSDGAQMQLTLNLTDASPAVILAAACDWAAAHAEPLTRRAAVPARPAAGGRLRIGYLVEYVLTHDAIVMPIVENHTAAVETAVYALRPPTGPHDRRARRYRAAAGLYRDCAEMDPETTAAQIRADGVDILVEGMGFASFAGSFSILARRAAPIQVHFPVMTTTGMTATDVCLVDPIIAPPGAESGFVERLVRLPAGYHVQPPEDLPDIRPRDGGGAVFGSFNSLNKISAATLRVWGEILRRTPDSSLLIKASDLTPAAAVRLRRTLCDDCGIDASRIVLRAPAADYRGHLEVFNEIDIHLDSFPYGGVTTTVEALWMGRPVVTLSGARVLDRYSARFLTLLGLSDLVADDAAEYVRIACALAEDAARRREFLSGLRQQTLLSSLCHGPTFIAGLEAAYLDLAQQAQAAR